MYEFLVWAFMRPSLLTQCLTSLREQFPDHVIRVADDSPESMQDIVAQYSDVQYYRMPENVGASACRNMLLSQVKGDYFVMMNHDHIIMDRRAVQYISLARYHSSAGIAAGLVWDVNALNPRNDFGEFRKEQGEPVFLRYPLDAPAYRACGSNRQIRYCYCQYASDFFMGDMRRFRSNKLKWDETLHQGAGADFYLNIPSRVPVISVVTSHVRRGKGVKADEEDPAYLHYRASQLADVTLKRKYGLSGDFFHVRDYDEKRDGACQRF